MIEHAARITGPFAGVDALYIILGIVILIGIVGATAVVARQVAAMTPKPTLGGTKAKAEEAAKAGAEFESWTEKPAASRNYESEYYSMYGSPPAARGDYQGPNAPRAPPAPATRGRDVTVDLGSPSGNEVAPTSSWEPAGAEWSRNPARPQSPMGPPEPTGPTDDFVAPSHSRSARGAGANPWQNLPAERRASAPNSPSAQSGGPLPPSPPLARVERGQPSPRSAPPPPVPPAPSARPGSGRSTFGASQANQTVVGTGDLGAKEGTDLAPERKAIRCPKCSTVFPGPATRPAMVKCPACGTGGMMK